MRKPSRQRCSDSRVIDTSVEKLGDGVRRITAVTANIIIDAIGGEVLSEALGRLRRAEPPTTLTGAGEAAINVGSDLKRPYQSLLFAQPQAARLTPGIRSSLCFNPARSQSWRRPSRWPQRLMLRYLVGGPFGRVVSPYDGL
jgi:hypothetical protein